MALSLSKRGYEVKIICMQDKELDLPAREKYDGLEIQRVRLLTRPLPRVFGVFKYIEFAFKALKYIMKFNPEIIHCHDFNTLPIGVIFSKRMNVIYDSHELETGRDRATRYRSILVGMLESLFMKVISTTITVNEEIASILSKKYNTKVYTIYNAYSPTDIKFDSSHSIRRVINAKEDQFIVIYPGILSHNRGMSKVVDAVKFLNENISIVLIGYGPIKEDLREEVSKLGLQDKVHVLDAVPYDIVIQYIATSDLGIMPTLNSSESYKLELGNKFFQYIAAGIPVGVSDQPVKKRMVERYGIGIVFNAEDPRDIAAKINVLSSEKNLYLLYMKNTRKAQKELCWEVEERKLLRLYENILVG
jgi:glycosyltransferase involved in cell wall biosynthesis